MQELLGRITALDPEASVGLRVIACFDELIVGRVNTRALLAAAASLAGCTAGVQVPPARSLRVSPAGEVHAGEGAPCGSVLPAAGGITVWLERADGPWAHDAMILERLALAVAIRQGDGRREPDTRRELGLLLDPSVPDDERRVAAARIGLAPRGRYRVVAAPLFAVWERHPDGPEDVVPTPFGPIHARVIPHDHPDVGASPSGTGAASAVDGLPGSFRTALVALRLCDPPATPSVRADDYGGLLGLLADSPPGAELPDVDLLDRVVAHPWGRDTLDALVRAGTVRQAARLGGVHHSTMQNRLDLIVEVLGFDPLDGLGRTRLGIAYLSWRLRTSRVLDLPAPPADQ